MRALSSFSNRELNIWATLLLDILVTFYYFTGVFSMSEGSAAEYGKLIGKIIVFSIIYSIIVFSIINGRKGQERRDERDWQFEVRANSMAYHFLVVSIGVVIGHLVINGFWANYDPDRFAFLQSPIVIAHALLLILIVTSAAKALAQLFYYRRGY